MHVEKIPLTLITLPAEMHRRALDAARLQDLAQSIEAIGLLNPITVERDGDHYVLRAGHRRLEATRLLRRDTIDCNVRDGGELAHGEILTWAENLQRDDLSQVEEAEAVQRMLRATGWTVEHTARYLHRSTGWVTDRLELLEAPEDLRDLVHHRDLPMSHARELARVTDDAHRAHLTRYALMSGASYPVMRDWVAQWRLHANDATAAPAPLPILPQPGERYIVLMPCLTCGQSHPADLLRVARICPECHASVLQATADWRRATTETPRSVEEHLDGAAPAPDAQGERS